MWIDSGPRNGLKIAQYPIEAVLDSLSRRCGLQPKWFQFVEWEDLVASSINVLVVDLYIDTNTTKRRSRRDSSIEDSIHMLLNFTRPIVFTIRGDAFTIIKATARLLTCVEVKYVVSQEYTVLPGSNNIYINETRETLTEKEYFANTTIKHGDIQIPVGTIAVCRQHLSRISTSCNGTYITLEEDEYVMLPNNSVYRNISKTVYNEGNYSRVNGSVVVCTEYSNKYTKRARQVERQHHNTALVILTYIGLSLSVLCLVFVLVTYLLFGELRTLPGINLMNLSTALLVANVFWLIGSGQTGVACVAIAVILHFTFLASFAWMSIIAFSTWKAFSSAGNIGMSSDKEYRQKRIRRTLAVGWLPVLSLVVICLTIDQSGVVEISYGGPKGCWINKGLANLFIFVLPLAVSVIWNAVFFGLTVKAIYKAKKQARMVTEQLENRRNSSVYIKIAVLMGFTWIFGFLALLESTYFEYPFVIFNTLQGVYIALAFTFNSRVKKLYRLKVFKRKSAKESQTTTNKCLKHTTVHTRV
jgi:hypothetical protein